MIVIHILKGKHMLKKIAISLSFLVVVLFLAPISSFAIEPMTYFDITRNAITPIPCGTSEARSCPTEMMPVYQELGEPCARSFQEFSRFPTTRHFWIEDPAVTAQGKANDRARQFIYWTINSRAIDDHPVLREIWGITSTVAFFFVVIVAAIFGLGFIVSRRTNFDLNLELWPTVIKLGIMLLYIALSASIVMLLIQLSEILMRFFIDNMGGKDLFTIYFTSLGNLGTTERNYIDFVGCRDLNIRVQEAADTKMFLYKLTNITYYIMGTMIILRKILLWFLLFVAPFLALLMPFVFIRNIGWIWIGVFFQWLMYGPLFALFLGALSKIWKAGIPFTFDFSRVIPVDRFGATDNPLIGYTYPTALNILYGGPAQINDRTLSAVNSGSYVDTFSEYVITIIMLWAVTFFPWWLLRIFRDYCCDGIYAMKNVLFSMYEDARSSKGKKDGPTPKFDLKQVLRVPTRTDVNLENKTAMRIATTERMKTMATHEISTALDMKASRLTDIAHMEMNQTRMSAVQKNFAMLANPAQATTGAERSQFMNLRTELFNRAIKQDSVARTLLSSTSTSSYERNKIREELIKSINSTVTAKSTATISAEQMNELARTMSSTMKSSAMSSASAASNASRSSETSMTDRLVTSGAISAVSQATNSAPATTRTILETYSRANTEALNKSIGNLSRQLNMSSEQVRNTIQASTMYMSRNTSVTNLSQETLSTIARSTNTSIEATRTILEEYSRSTSQTLSETVKSLAKELSLSTEQIQKTIETALTKAESSTSTASSTQTRNGTVALNKEAITEIAKAVNSSTESTQKILEAYSRTNARSMNEAVRSLAKELNMSTQQIRNTLDATITQQASKTNKIMTSYMGKMLESEKALAKIAEKSKLTQQQTKDILSAYTQNMNRPANQVVPNVSVSAKVTESQTKGALNSISGMFMTRNLILDFAEDNKVEVDAVEQAVAKTLGATGGTGETPDIGGPGGGTPLNPTKTAVELAEAGKGGTPGKEAAAGQYEGTGGGPAPAPTNEELQLSTALAERAMKHKELGEQLGIENMNPQDKPAIVRHILRTISDNKAVTDVLLKEVSETEQVQAEEASQVVQEQLTITAKPEENIEKIVAVPASISLEEYEDLKEMWEHQYEEGEIPIQENIQTREEWVDQDIVTITNVMNKVLSPDEKIQQQGLDELGYIIPIFMINNLKGDQLITYLKAKLEAAKLVKKLLDREKTVQAKLEKGQLEEEFVDLKPEKKDEQLNQPMHMEFEEEKGPTTIEERAQVEVQAAPEVNKAYTEEPESVSDSTPEDSGNSSVRSNDYYSQSEDSSTSSQGKEIPWDDEEKKEQLKEYGEEESPREYGAEEDVIKKLKEYDNEK